MNPNIKEVSFRYYLKNSAPIELLDFTKSLEAIQDEYTHFIETKGVSKAQTRLNIHEVKQGSIICEIIEAIPTIATTVGSINTLFEFGSDIRTATMALIKGTEIPSEAKNARSLSNLSNIVSPLARTPNSTLTLQTIDLGSGNQFENCTINISTTEGNALQNLANIKKQELTSETTKTEESKSNVLLRLVQINKEQETLQDKGIVEAFDKNKKKLLFKSEEVKKTITDGNENFFKYLYYVDVTAMYSSDRIVAYRIDKVHDKFLPED